jgi:hypothetical protein
MDNAALSSRLGVFIQPGVGTAYPELVAIVRGIYRSRVSRLAFVPSYWLAEVLAAMEGDNLVLPTPVGFKSLAYPIPAWLSDDTAAMSAWAAVGSLVKDAEQRFLAGRIEEGRAVMAAADANASFWNGLYSAAVAVRDLPGDAVAAVAKGTASAAGSFIGKAWWVWIAAGVLALAWMGRGAIASAAVRRVTK